MNRKARLIELSQRLAQQPPREEKGAAGSRNRKSKNTKSRISEKRKSEKQGRAKAPRKKAALQANPPHGEKGDFVKVTVTLPPAVYTLISDEVVRRKIAKERDAVMAAIIREAVVEKLAKKK